MMTRLGSGQFTGCVTFNWCHGHMALNMFFSVASQRDRSYSLSLYTFIIQWDWKLNLTLGRIMSLILLEGHCRLDFGSINLDINKSSRSSSAGSVLSI